MQLAYGEIKRYQTRQTLRIQHACPFGLFVTKCRNCVFSQTALQGMRDIFAVVCKDFDAELVEFDGERDHVYPLINYPPKVAVSKMVNSLKGVSSRLLRKTRKELRACYCKGVLWPPSYFSGLL
jgi:putative transposase